MSILSLVYFHVHLVPAAQWYHSCCAGNTLCWTNITAHTGGRNCDEIFSYQEMLFLSKKGSNCTRRCWLWWNFALRKKHTHTHQNWNILKHISNVQIIYFKKWSIRSFFSFQKKKKHNKNPQQILYFSCCWRWGGVMSGRREGVGKGERKRRKNAGKKQNKNQNKTQSSQYSCTENLPCEMSKFDNNSDT